jgi:ribosomal protein L37AE/L43A
MAEPFVCLVCSRRLERNLLTLVWECRSCRTAVVADQLVAQMMSAASG